MKRFSLGLALVLVVAACGDDTTTTTTESAATPLTTIAAPQVPTTTTTTTTTQPSLSTTLDACATGRVEALAMFDAAFDLYDDDPSQMLDTAAVSQTFGTIATLLSNDCNLAGAGESLSAAIVYVAGQAAVREEPTVAFIVDFLPAMCDTQGVQLSSDALDVCSGESGQAEGGVVSNDSPETGFEDGMWIVGTDIDPGTYATSGAPGCYWERLSGFSGSFDEILANGLSDDRQIVTIQAGDAGFFSEDCGTWELVE